MLTTMSTLTKSQINELREHAIASGESHLAADCSVVLEMYRTHTLGKLRASRYARRVLKAIRAAESDAAAASVVAPAPIGWTEVEGTARVLDS